MERLLWLDLACGRGQILEGLSDSLSDRQRSKITYWAYDVDQTYAREAQRAAASLGLAGAKVFVGDLGAFQDALPPDALFDFITLTNTVHEIAPSHLARLLVGAVVRLAPEGTAYIYDMERVKPPELGALPWGAQDVRAIASELVAAFGAPEYEPGVSGWHHRTVDGWHLQIDRKHIGPTAAVLAGGADAAIAAIAITIEALMKRRLADCRRTLEAFTMFGVETAEEQEDRTHLLYDYWALTRALTGDE
jgi:hypothetical protein